MRQVGNFDTRSPDRLSEQLDRLQANVDAETQSIRLSYMREPAPKVFNGSDPFAAFGADQIAVVDTTTGNVSLGLTKPTGPGFAALCKRVAANTVTLTPAGANGPAPVLINGAPSKTYAAGVVGLFWLFFDGLNWWA